MKCPKCGYVFNDTRNEAQRNKFHAVVRDYMSVTGYDFEYAKTELKYLFGIWAELRYSTEKRIVEYYYNTGGCSPHAWG